MRLSKEEVRQIVDNRKTSRLVQDIPVGSLVTLAPWCENSGRLAHVVSWVAWNPHSLMIQWIDEAGLKSEPVQALAANLVVLEEQ